MMKQEDYFFLTWIEGLELWYKWWKLYEDWWDIFWVVRQKED